MIWFCLTVNISQSTARHRFAYSSIECTGNESRIRDCVLGSVQGTSRPGNEASCSAALIICPGRLLYMYSKLNMVLYRIIMLTGLHLVCKLQTLDSSLLGFSESLFRNPCMRYRWYILGFSCYQTAFFTNYWKPSGQHN